MRVPSSCRAFTLIELLVVIAISKDVMPILNVLYCTQPSMPRLICRPLS